MMATRHTYLLYKNACDVHTMMKTIVQVSTFQGVHKKSLRVRMIRASVRTGHVSRLSRFLSQPSLHLFLSCRLLLQVFQELHDGDANVLVCAPTGSGKTACAELALMRLFNTNPDARAVYIAPKPEVRVSAQGLQLKQHVSERSLPKILKFWRVWLSLIPIRMRLVGNSQTMISISEGFGLAVIGAGLRVHDSFAGVCGELDRMYNGDHFQATNVFLQRRLLKRPVSHSEYLTTSDFTCA